MSVIDRWSKVTHGGAGGTIAESGEGALMTSPGGGARAYLSRKVNVKPGSIITVRALVEHIDGDPRMAIDHPVLGSSVAVRRIQSNDLMDLPLSWTVPLYSDEATITVNIGVFTTDVAAGCRIYSPRVEVDGVDLDIGSSMLESGSNANGTYTKFPDGLLICQRSDATFTYLSANQLSCSWSRPHLFLSGSNSTITYSITNDGADYTDVTRDQFGVLAQHNGANGLIILERAGGASNFLATSEIRNVQLTAIGRWK